MPLIRCLSCNLRLDARLAMKGRHRVCWLELKRQRSEHMRQLGPAPQHLPCHHCDGYARVGDPMVWDHFPKRFVDGGRAVVVSHASCNQRRKKNRRKQ